jgi:EAL domain-containing protein (putative c-di-GMP-specific phosphodiesterase class I)
MSETNDQPARVVIIDDDEMVARALSSLLAREGYAVETFSAPREAVERIGRDPVDVVLSDVSMPGMTGLEMLSALRERRADVPVVFVTGAPRVEDAMRAMELGAFRYLAKPLEMQAVRQVVAEAIKWGRLSRASAQNAIHPDREELDAAFTRTVASMWMAYQPIVSPTTREVFGYEALMRSSDPALPTPPAVLDAAEKLGRLHALGRQLRDIVAVQAGKQPFDHTFFVNLHSADLADTTLYDPTSPLSAFASSVVLEITERASLESIAQVERRIDSLRRLGFRIAVDDLGAGYAGLSYFARVAPDIVKIDMSLTRGVDQDPVRRRVVGSICTLARDLHMTIVAEGIETEGELACVRDLGAELVQGYLIARPAPYPVKRVEG